MGSRVDEGPAAAPGHIRALDVRTGKLQWIFHTIPQPGEYGYETWEDPEAYKHIGGANSWAVFPWMKKEESYLHRRDQRLLIFMVAEGKDKICLQIVYSHLMQQRENASGIFNLFIMMYGIGILPAPRL